MLYFITHRHLILNHQQGIENTGLSLVNDTVCMTDMLDHLFTHPLVGKDYGVDPVVGNRFLSRHDIRRYILTEAATGLCHRPGTDTAALTCQYITSEDRIIFKETITGDLATVTQYAMVSDMCIV